MFRILFFVLIFCPFIFFSKQSYAKDFTAETDCNQKAETAVMLSLKGFDPIPVDDCRVIYYTQACEFIKGKVLEKLRTSTKSSHLAIQSRANSVWFDLVSMLTTAPSKVCDNLDHNGQLPEDFGALF